MAHETRAGILAGKPTLSPPIDYSERGVIVMVDEHSETTRLTSGEVDALSAYVQPSHGLILCIERLLDARFASRCLAAEAKLERVREVMALRQVRHDCKVGWSAAMQFLDEAMADQPTPAPVAVVAPKSDAEARRETCRALGCEPGWPDRDCPIHGWSK